jgi:hypothetical protein
MKKKTEIFFGIFFFKKCLRKNKLWGFGPVPGASRKNKPTESEALNSSFPTDPTSSREDVDSEKKDKMPDL